MGKRGGKIEIKNKKKKHSTRWMERVQNYLQLQNGEGKKKKKMNTWAYCEIKCVFSMCALQRTSLRYELRTGKRNSLSHKDGTSVCKFRKGYLFRKIALCCPARRNEDHTQNLSPAYDCRLFNHNQNLLKNVNELHRWTEMPVVAKPPREIPYVRLGLPQDIIYILKKNAEAWVPQKTQRSPRSVCSVAAITAGSTFEKADLGKSRRQVGSPALAGMWAPLLHCAGGVSRSADWAWLAMNQQTVPHLSLPSWRKPSFLHLQADVLVRLMVTYSNLPFSFQSRKTCVQTPGDQQSQNSRTLTSQTPELFPTAELQLCSTRQVCRSCGEQQLAWNLAPRGTQRVLCSTTAHRGGTRCQSGVVLL